MVAMMPGTNDQIVAACISPFLDQIVHQWSISEIYHETAFQGAGR